MKTPVVFFGSSIYVIPIIELLHNEYDLQLVVTTETSETLPIPQYCNKHHIPYLSTHTLTSEKIITTLQNTHAEVAILASFGVIVNQETIALFPQGIVNIHPSLLPSYRGPTPGVQAILDGEKTTGVSIMLLDNKVDHGPLLAQETATILPEDTADSLYKRLFQQGAHLLGKKLPDYLHKTIIPKEQNHTAATFTPKLTRESGFFSLETFSLDNNLQRKIRAYFPWPGVWTTYVLQENQKEKIIKFLPHQKIQVEGKNPMSYVDFMNGYEKGKFLLEKMNLV